MKRDTLLLRQVNRAWIQQGRVTSQVFKPTAKDSKRLSVYNGELINAEDAWRHYTEKLGFSSAGVLGVTVRECEDHELSAEPGPEPFPEHAVIRFDGCSPSQIKKKAAQLTRLAVARDWLYRTET
ncbi:MAG: hypothetical protein ACLFV4_14285 [Candidatus Hydrogenedentota bacterium]